MPNTQNTNNKKEIRGRARTAYGLKPSDKFKLVADALSPMHDGDARRAISLVGVPFYNSQHHHPDFHTDKWCIIEHDRLTIFSEPASQEVRAQWKEPAERKNPKGKTTGYFTKSAAKRLKKCLVPWVLAHQVTKELNHGSRLGFRSYLTFATFTLPAKQTHTDNELKRELLMPFLQHLVRGRSVELYLWRAETQKNGNLHFHIFFDRYIEHSELQNTWNSHLDRLGYIDQFEQKHNHRNPPTTDIRKCPETTHLVSYVMKYAGKRPMIVPSFAIVDGKRVKKSTPYHPLKRKYIDKTGATIEAETSKDLCEMRPIQGRMWGCSDKLREVDSPNCSASHAVDYVLEAAEARPEFRVVKRPMCTLIYGKVDRLIEELHPGLWFWWLSWHQHNYNKLYSTSYQVEDYDLGRPDIQPTDPKGGIRHLLEIDNENNFSTTLQDSSLRPNLIEVPF